MYFYTEIEYEKIKKILLFGNHFIKMRRYSIKEIENILQIAKHTCEYVQIKDNNKFLEKIFYITQTFARYQKYY